MPDGVLNLMRVYDIRAHEIEPLWAHCRRVHYSEIDALSALHGMIKAMVPMVLTLRTADLLADTVGAMLAAPVGNAPSTLPNVKSVLGYYNARSKRGEGEG